MRKIILCISLMSLSISLFGAISISINLQTDTDIVTRSQCIPGEPIVTYKNAKILIPFGEQIEKIDVQFKNPISTKNKAFEIGIQQQPISKPQKIEKTKNIAVLERNAFYPYRKFNANTQYYKGHQIVFLDLFNEVINPVTKHLKTFQVAEINITTSKNSSILDTQKKKFQPVKKLPFKIINKSALQSYPATAFSFSRRGLPMASDPHAMIIVTTTQAASYFQDFILWKNAQGIDTGLFTMEDIYNEYDGVDNAEKLRQFVIDAYETYNGTATPLQYLLLGGDTELVPYRGCYGVVGDTEDYGIPTDLYFGCLDGNWDGNNNGVYGEFSDNTDLLPEVSVGRIPAETEEEFDHFFNKAYTYVEQASYTDDITYFLGERLDDIPTWGGDYKDEIEQYLPTEFHLEKRYQKENTYSLPIVTEAYNEGFGIINHMGHANTNFLMGLSGALVQQFTNNKYGIVYSQGCYPASFDIEETSGAESVSEHLLTASGGALAFIGNTRYGWYYPGNTNGASQYYDHEFFEALFVDNIRELGKTLDRSKTELVDEAMTNSVMRWVYFELVLFGDPSIAVKSPHDAFPYITAKEVQFEDISGDNDGAVNPGETISISMSLENIAGWHNAENISAVLTFEDDLMNITQDSIFVASLNTNETLVLENSFEVEIPEDLALRDYTFSIRIHADANGYQFDKKYNFLMPISINLANWPQYISQNFRSCFYYDENSEALISPDFNGNIFSFSTNGEQTQIAETDFTAYMMDSAAYADINNDGEVDIIGASRNGDVFAISKENEVLFHVETASFLLKNPVVADFDGDANWEIAVVGLDSNLYIFDHVGTLLDGFPVLLDNPVVHSLAAADTNQDGKSEIIAVDSQNTLVIYDDQAQIIHSKTLDGAATSAPIILENSYIAVGIAQGRLQFYNLDDGTTSTVQVDGDIVLNPVAADFNNDGMSEVIVATNSFKVYAINTASEILSGWPVEVGETISSSPVIADLNNDDLLDVIVQENSGRIFVWNQEGDQFGISPIEERSSGNNALLLTDFDGDNDLDLIYSSAGLINVVDFKFTQGNTRAWTAYRGNHRRTGNVLDSIEQIVENNEVNAFISELKSYPNPFTKTVIRSDMTIQFNLKKSSDVEFSVYNLRGQKVFKKQYFNLTEGQNKVFWNTKSSNNKSVASGIYFYKITSDNDTKLSKMIIIR